MEPTVLLTKPEDVCKLATITITDSKNSPGYHGKPFNVLSVCLPFMIIEGPDVLGKPFKTMIDTRDCTLGLLTDEYVETYLEMKKRD